MLEPFPELSYLYIAYPSRGDITPVLPDAFLGGFAPSLQSLELVNVAFPALSVSFLSATRLTSLRLWSTAYISPEAMVTRLLALPNLEDFGISFQSYPDHTSPSPLTRAILPSLTSFHFHGIGQYSENLLSRIDAPTLQTLSITFLDLVFRIPQLYRFLSCTEKFELPNEVVVEFDTLTADLKFMQSENLRLTIVCGNLVRHRQVSSMAAMCRELSPLLSHVEHLDLHGKILPLSLFFQGHTAPANTDWLELFYPFTTVQSLHVSKNLGRLVARALEELTKEGATAVFPKLRTLSLEELQPSGSVREAIETFIATRGLSGNPVVLQQGL
jgi:hypothetical protein